MTMLYIKYTSFVSCCCREDFFTYFHYKSMVDNDMPGAWPVWTQGALLAGFIKIPAVVSNFRKGEEKPSNSLSRQPPFRLHFTIRFSIGDNVNVLSPSSKTRHTKFTRLVSF